MSRELRRRTGGYLNPSGSMMAVSVAAKGAGVEPGAPIELFHRRIWGGGVDTQQGRNYAVAPDGRFPINTALDNVSAAVTVVQNWNPAPAAR